MRFSTLKETIKICRMAGVSLQIWGHRGVGKSSVIAQVAEEEKMGYINMRLSQKEASDIRGLPDRVDGLTTYLPPADMPRGGLSRDEYSDKIDSCGNHAEKMAEAIRLMPQLDHGILFLDEINRAQDDVLQAVFELVLDRTVGQYVLPEGWSIVCAGNFNEGSYITNGFTDSAFLDRFCHVTLSDGESTLDEWVQWMSGVHGGAASDVVEFVTQDLKRLDGQVEGDLGFSIQPSRRSWDAVVRILKVCAQGSFSEEARIGTIQGLVGMDLGASFGRYDCPVKPRSLIKDGVEKWVPQLNKLERGQIVGLMWGLTSYLKKSIDKEDSSNVALDFAEWMVSANTDHDLIAAFLKSLVDDDDSNVRELKSMMIANAGAAKTIASIINKKKTSKTFIDRLIDREELHQIISRMTWGAEDE